MNLNGKKKYDIYESDAAPFFFYIDVIPLDLTHYEIKHHIKLLKSIKTNPIMPLPLRVDRVYNGESSVLIRPNKPISFPLEEDYIAIINPENFVQKGIEKLLYHTEIRGSKEFISSLSNENVKDWWEKTRNLYGRLKFLEDDFISFLNAYLHIMVKSKLNNEDLIEAAIEYSELIKEICNKRIRENSIFVKVKEKEKITNLYKMKKKKTFEGFKRVEKELLYPSFVDIEVVNLENIGFNQFKEKSYDDVKKQSRILKYIPLLIYDDLLECMLQNLKTLKNKNINILNPSYLIEKNIIMIIERQKYNEDGLDKYSWFKDFNEIDLDIILESIKPTFIK